MSSLNGPSSTLLERARFLGFAFAVIPSAFAAGCSAGSSDAGATTGEDALVGAGEVSEQTWPEVRRLAIHQREGSGAFLLRAYCTATFVAPNVALTAAHCLCNGDRYTLEIAETWDDYVATRTERHPDYDCSSRTPGPHDVGFVFFADTVRMPFLGIAAGRWAVQGDDVTAVGYGDNMLALTSRFFFFSRIDTSREASRRFVGELDYRGKRVASTVFDGTWSEGFVHIEASFEAPSGSNVTSLDGVIVVAQGDSGGPLLRTRDKSIVAVMSRGGFGNPSGRTVRAISEFADVADHSAEGANGAFVTANVPALAPR